MSGMDKERVQKLINGELPHQELRNDILLDPKDSNRFQTVWEVLQEQVDWDDPILIPLNDHLYIVGTDEGRVVRRDCGHDFCSADENWKTACQVRVREGEDEMDDLYPEHMGTNPEWTFQLREFYCPDCYSLITVDSVPAGYPVLQPFEPDIDTFYEEWLGEPAPDKR